MVNATSIKTLALIANRNAGKGKIFQALQEARRCLWGWPLEVIWPSSVDDLRSTLARLDPSTYEAAIVMGGDGTLNQVLRGRSASAVPLCVFPIGTANDFARELGIRADWGQIQSLLDGNSTEAVDLIEVNGVPFLTVAGIGVGALLTEEFNERRAESRVFRELMKHLQSQVYTALAAKTLLLRRDYAHSIHIRSNVFDEKLKAAAVFVCNQDKLGGNLRVALTNDNRDEFFSVLVVPNSNSAKLVSTLMKFKMGTLSPRDCILFAAREVTIRELDGRSLQVFGDGETLVESPLLEFSLLPRALRVYRGARL